MDALKPVAPSYMLSMVTLKPGDRLHRLVSRLADTWIDDLTDDRIIELERMVDTFRLTHADGTSLTKSEAA